MSDKDIAARIAEELGLGSIAQKYVRLVIAKHTAELDGENKRLREAVRQARIFGRNWQPDEPGPMAYQFGKFVAEMDEAYSPTEDSGTIGKKEERKVETLVFAENTSPSNDQIAKAAAEYETDGWKFDVGSMQQGDGSYRGDDALINARYTRYVERENDGQENQG